VAGGHGTGAIQKALQAKQPNTSTSNAPLHVTGVEAVNAIITRADASVNFATSIAANQPVATAFDRVRAYSNKKQFLEVESRAMPLSAYFHSYLRYITPPYRVVVPGVDKALANNTQTFAQYRLAGFLPRYPRVRIEDVMKAQPYTGVGAVSSYSANDGSAGDSADEPEIAPFYIARAFGSSISSLTLRGVRAWMLSAANDINSGFTMKAGGRAYVAEEINDIEERVSDFLGTAQMSLTGSASAALRGARGQPQDPFTGSAVFLFGDIYDSPTDVTIIIGTSQAVQVGAYTVDGIESIST